MGTQKHAPAFYNRNLLTVHIHRRIMPICTHTILYCTYSPVYSYILYLTAVLVHNAVLVKYQRLYGTYCASLMHMYGMQSTSTLLV